MICWTKESKYHIVIVKLDMLFWRHCVYRGSFLFHTGLLKWRSAFSVGTVCLDAYLHMWYHDLEMLSVSLAFCAANTPISRGCFLHYWTFVHLSPVDYSDKWYRLSIFSLMLASTRWVSCWIYSRVHCELRGHGGHVMWLCTIRNISHASFIFCGRWC